MTLLEPGRTTLRNILVHISHGEPLAARLTLSRLLAAADFRPAGLPSAATFVVRRLRDPLPGKLRLDREAISPPPAWICAVRETLDLLASQAAQPIEGPVPANAEAVIFRDRSELLACLADDWCSGDLVSHWWWQALLRRGGVPHLVIATWLEAPEYIPMALEWLESKQLVLSFMQKLTEDTSHKMISLLVQAYGLHELLPLIDQDALRHSARLQSAKKIAEIKGFDESPNSDMQGQPPWQRWIQNSSINQLSADRQLLLGVGLMLHRAPSIVRTASFAKQVRDWQNLVDCFRSGEPTSELHVLAQPAGDLTAEGNVRVEAVSEILPDATVGQTTKESVSPGQMDLDSVESRVETSSEPSPMVKPSPRSVTDQILKNERGSAASEVVSASRVTQSTATKEDDSLDRLDLEARESRVETASEPSSKEKSVLSSDDMGSENRDQGIEILRPDMGQSSIAEANVSRSCIEGKTHEKSVEAADIEIQSEFGGICYFINLGLYLNFYGDFTTPLQPGIDLPIWDFVALIAQQIIGEEVTGDPVWSLLAQLAGRAADESPGAHFDPPGHQSLQVWLTELMSTVRPRLRLALGTEDKEMPQLFTRRAHIRVTHTQFDAFFSLDELPIEIRMAGLDRDPGWVPAAGRYIYFHYD